MPRPRRRPFAFVRLATLLAAALAAPMSLAQAPLPPAAAPYGAVVPTLQLPAPGQTLPAPMVSPLPAVPPAATVPAGTLPGIVQPLPPPPPTPLFPGFSSPTTSPNPFAPLPAGAVIGPGGPVVPGPPLTKSNSVVIPPIDAEVVWQQMVDTMDDFFKIQSEQRVVFANGIPAEGRIDTYPQTGATLLEPWRGLRDAELVANSGIDGCKFVHATGFIGGNATYDGALAMALKTIEGSTSVELK